MLVEMELREIQINEESLAHQIIILGEKDGKRVFPIYIGHTEAMAMDFAIRKIDPPRPLTHNLIINILEGLNVTLKHVIVCDLRNDTFYGNLVLTDAEGNEVIIDSRPSDAIVLASRLDIPIFVDEKVLNEVSHEEDAEGEF